MENLYNAKEFMIRYPYRSTNQKDLYNDEDIILKAYENKEFMEQILVSSKSLYDMIEKYVENKDSMKIKKVQSIKLSIYKYWNRSCTRTTPFGLFSKVNIGKFKNNSNNLINNNLYFKKVNLDINWLNKFIRLIEKTENKKLAYVINDAVYNMGDRAYLLYCVDMKNR